MAIHTIYVHVSFFMTTFLLVTAWKCNTSNCLSYPLSLKLWNNHIQVSARTLNVKVGSEFSVTCDGSCVGSRTDPHLRWYGPDKHWIAYEGYNNRINIDQSFSSRFLKFHIKKVTVIDEGLYTCRGWLGHGRGWDIRTIRLLVDHADVLTSHAMRNVSTPSTSTVVTIPESVATSEITTETTTESVVIPETTTTESTPGNVVTSVITSDITTAEGTCLPPNFKCSNGECFEQQYVCDDFPDCSDASDESNCADTCLSPKFKCGSGECVDHGYVCDAYPDCQDASDESNCVSLTCTEDMTACGDNKSCVTALQICDGTTQCGDGSDEDPTVCRGP